ncbi:MAG: PIN domain-containing protein [Treponemataceae bacterium]|nr:MAG: PIN domain-containing protein [Treponemataceae bacterium]
MKRKIFVDSDIIIDLLAERDLFYTYAAELFTLAYKDKIAIFTTALVLSNVFYMIRKIKGNAESMRQLKDLRLLVNILPISENIVDMALNSIITDFEDALQYFTAKENGLLAIITRNGNDFKIKDITIQTAEEYIKMNNEILENE